jgi:hypothetical protein
MNGARARSRKREPRRSGIGTGELDRTRLANGLVDEFHFWVFVLAAGSA